MHIVSTKQSQYDKFEMCHYIDSWRLSLKLKYFMYTADFDDMSCKMIFGQEPPPESLDPAFAKPCYKQCKHLLIVGSAYSHWSGIISRLSCR